jgi:uncharacterized protein YtpQ (UPF0354 family)
MCYARRMKRCAVTLVCAFLFSGCSRCTRDEPLGRPLDACSGRTSAEDRFTCRTAALVAEALPELTVSEVGTLSLQVTADEDRSMRANLDNLWAECSVSPESCVTNVDRVVSAVRETFASMDAPVERANVRAVIKPTAWVEDFTAQLRAQGVSEADGRDAQPLHRTFLTGLVIVYVEDRPDSMRMMVAADRAALGLDADALHELALANLRTACADFAHAPLAPGARVMRLTAGDSYESSRLLLPELWRPIASGLGGELVVAAPSRDRVLFATGSADDLAELRRLAAEGVAADPHPLTATLLRWTEDGWVELAAP